MQDTNSTSTQNPNDQTQEPPTDTQFVGNIITPSENTTSNSGKPQNENNQEIAVTTNSVPNDSTTQLNNLGTTKAPLETPLNTQSVPQNVPISTQQMAETASATGATITPPISVSSPSTATLTQPTVNTPMTDTMPPTKNTRKKRSIIMAIIAVITFAFLVGGGVFAYQSFIAISPEERLQKGIVNMASTSSLATKMSGKGTIDGSDLDVTVSFESDFSDPSVPKSKGTAIYNVAIYGISVNLNSEFICVSATECYVKYTEIELPEELASQGEPEFLNKWLLFDPNDTAQTADPFGSIGASNTVLGEFITGNVTGEAKSQVETFAANGTTYKITASNKENVNNTSAVKYSLELNKNDIISLNETVAKQYNIKQPLKESDVSEKCTVWVESNNNTIVKYSTTIDGADVTVTFSDMNKTVEIVKPESFLTPDQYSSIL